jgi:hypothetical protein
MFARILLPAFAVLSVAAAQSSNSVCSQATATITTPADATQYASCSTISGSVVISSDAANSIQLDGPQQITGDLIVSNATQLISFSSSTINAIGGAFRMDSLTLLSTLRFDELTQVGSIEWSALKALDTLTFPMFIQKAKSVLITNTFLSTLNGINLMTVATLNINNNLRLTNFSTQVNNITQLLNIEANGQKLNVQLPNLQTAANMTFRNVSTLSIPSLATVNGSLGFYGNYFESLSLPNLTTIGSKNQQNTGSLAIVANGDLANVSMPQLTTVQGAYQIANNSALQNISFPALSQIGGALDFSGNFSTPDLKSLSLVSGGFNMQSTAQIDCSAFDAAKKGGEIQGLYTCTTTADAKAGVGSSPTTSATGSKSSSSKGAAVSYGVSDALAGISVLGGLLQMLL